MPRPAPVTMATWFLSEFLVSFPLLMSMVVPSSLRIVGVEEL
jgi:hypothetical protein